jgi:hypothetical protein
MRFGVGYCFNIVREVFGDIGMPVYMAEILVAEHLIAVNRG